jgi:hypothetical protein
LWSLFGLSAEFEEQSLKKWISAFADPFPDAVPCPEDATADSICRVGQVQKMQLPDATVSSSRLSNVARALVPSALSLRAKIQPPRLGDPQRLQSS